MDKTYNELFSANDTLKLYDKTVQDLKRAIVTEKAYIKTLNDQLGELRKLG